MVSDLWWHIRPILTCDTRIYAEPQIDDFRAMIRIILENSNDDDTPIYDNVDAAKKDNAEGTYIVIEFDKKYCDEYNHALAMIHQEASPGRGGMDLPKPGTDVRSRT
jgi:hypothetical protein